MGTPEKTGKPLEDLLANAPKTLDRKYLRQLYVALFECELKQSKDADAMTSSLLLLVLEDDTSALDRYLAVAILQKMSPISKISEVLTSGNIPQLINALPILLIQGVSDSDTDNVIKRILWSLKVENMTASHQRLILSFLSRVVLSSDNPLTHDDLKEILALAPLWIRNTILPSPLKKNQMKRSSSTLSIFEIDGSDMHDFLTVLNYAQISSTEQYLNIQVFSMLRSWLLSTSQSNRKLDAKPCPVLADLISDEFGYTISEYCLRIVEQVERRIQSSGAVEFHKACLVEAISLLDVICRADSSTVHSILPIVKRVYEQTVLRTKKKPEVQDVTILTACMQFFINHSSCVMHKVDSLFPYLFCDLVDTCYHDNFTAFEIIFLIKENLEYLCYHSSILEKYFPALFKVFAWRPVTFMDDFLLLLPAFMCQHTSVEVFHTLLDLPCLTAMLVIINADLNQDKSIKDPAVLGVLKNSDLMPVFQFVLRKSSGIGDTFDKVGVFHQAIQSLVNHPRVTACAEAVIPLFRCYISTFLQYTDASVTVLLIPAFLERLSLIFPIKSYVYSIHSVFSDFIVKLFDLHPEAVFHCQKEVMQYISNFKNFCIADHCFVHLVWIVGEYASIEYSNMCKPEVILQYFEALESTIYEIIITIARDSDNMFLKVVSVSATTLAKLAARSQDLVPRAVLCLRKIYIQLLSFYNDHKKPWEIVKERILELLAILNTPNVASVILSPPRDMETGRLHKDGTSLPYMLRTVTALLDME